MVFRAKADLNFFLFSPWSLETSNIVHNVVSNKEVGITNLG